MKILHASEVKEIIDSVSPEDLIRSIEESFIAYSNGSASVPPVGYLGFQDPPGDVHIKYGHIKDDPYYIIKIASGFYDNYTVGLPTSDGMMIAFDAKTGVLKCLLKDEGYLTDLRTALAGAVSAKHIGPKDIKAIGVIGTGVQARMQLEMLKLITDCREVFVWGRSKENLEKYQVEMTAKGFSIAMANSPSEVLNASNLVVTTTPSMNPLIYQREILPGTHITAMGSDAPGKQEIDHNLFSKASVVACDSKLQCMEHGESHFAIENGIIGEADLHEIGEIIMNPISRKEDDITIADLTGIATQDIKIASLVLDQIDFNP